MSDHPGTVCCLRLERAEDLLRRIAASLEDGTLDMPDVCHAVEAEIAELLSPSA